MIYGGEISTPANTAETAPQRTVVPVAEGIIYHLKVYLPPGSGGLLHAQIFHSTYQVFPTSIGESFSGDNILLEYDVLYPMDSPPYEILIVTWNVDDSYDHTIQIHLSMESADEYKARYLPNLQMGALAQTLGAQEAEKATARRARVDSFLEKLEPIEGE